MSTLVIQSCSERQRQSWMRACLDSVERWSEGQGYDYRFVGDEIFEKVPPWYRAKVGGKLPVATDYGRLVLMRDALDAGYDEAIWFDADLLIFDRTLSLAFDGSCAFGQEVWIQRREGRPQTRQQAGQESRLEARRNVHNAVCVFRRGCPVLPFLLHTVESLVRRVDPAHIAPQFAGPRLLNALHSLADFALLPQVGALSPEVVADLVAGGGPALDLLRNESRAGLQAANICASVNADDAARAAIAALLGGAGI
ncbi:MAG: hypothetical protein ACO1PZ_11860 [Gammaproteobacteria bacterium]